MQGVGFRYSTVREARRLGICGWVRNVDDGAVEGHAQGDAASLAEFHQWLHRGPPAARVDGVDWQPVPLEAAPGFNSR